MVLLGLGPNRTNSWILKFLGIVHIFMVLASPKAALAQGSKVFPDLSPQIQERVICSITAAVKYEVPANIMLALSEKEGGKPGQWVRNSNNTHDVGTMQFNTKYLKDLARYGIRAEDVAAAGCYPFDLAAWRLRGHIKNDKGDLWTKAANYHSRTPEHNVIYRADLKLKAVKWADWLEARFVTVDVSKAGSPSSHPSPRKVQVQSVAAEPVTSVVALDQPGPDAFTKYVPRQLIR